MKICFCDEHTALELVWALIMKESALDQANMLQYLQDQQEELVNKFKRDMFEVFKAYG